MKVSVIACGAMLLLAIASGALAQRPSGKAGNAVPQKAQSHAIITCGQFYSLVLLDGTLYGWGDNSYGQLGIGKTATQFIPLQLSEDNGWRFIATGLYHNLAIRKDGSLWGWGWAGNDELGLGIPGAKPDRPTRIGRDTSWASVSTADGHTVAIKTNGSLWIWGTNISGELGIGPTPLSRAQTPYQLGRATDWALAVAGDHFTLAVKKDGSLWSWGRNLQGSLGLGIDNTIVQAQPTQVGNDKDWAAVFTGFRGAACFAIKRDGTLWAWGSNGDGQLGLPIAYKKVTLPTQVSAARWTSIANMSGCTMGIQADGSLWHWGGGVIEGPRLGATPRLIANAPHAQAIALGTNHALAMAADGTLWSWGGSNYYGQLGQTTDNRFSATMPTQIRRAFEPDSRERRAAAASEANSFAEGAALLFTGTKTSLTNLDKSAIYQQLGFVLSKDGKRFAADRESLDYPFDAHIYAVDLNKDGQPEIFVVYGNTFTSGHTGSSVVLFIKDNTGTWKANLGFPGMAPDILPTGNGGYPDLLIGGPGFEFPVWRWNGRAYALNRKIKDADLKRLKTSNVADIR